MLNQFFASARNKNQWYRYLLTLLIVFLFVVILSSMPFMFSSMIIDGGVDYESIIYNGIPLKDILFLVVDILRSIGMSIGVIMGVWWVHKRSWMSLITAYSSVRWERFLFGITVWFGLMGVGELIAYAINSDKYTFQFDGIQWIILSITVLLTIPLQVIGRELLFRGYLMQGIGWGTKRPWIALVLTSIAFGCLFFLNPAIKTHWLRPVTIYTTMGLFLGIISLMDDGIELAIGVHIIDNIFGSVLEAFLSSELPMTFRTKVLDDWGFFGISVIFYALFIWICSKKYGWTDWGKLTRKIIDPNPKVDLELVNSIGR